MNENKKKKSLISAIISLIFLVIFIQLIMKFAAEYTLNLVLDEINERKAIENTNMLSNNEIYENVKDIKNTSNTNSKSFIIASIENSNSYDLSYKYKMITDENIINNLVNIVNKATIYEPKTFIPHLGDIPPRIEFYLDGNEKYTIFAGDNINDDGNVLNLMVKYNSFDGSDKKLYKVDTELAKYIELLYNDTKTNTIVTDKEIYQRVIANNISSEELSFYNEKFIVIQDDRMYFSTDLSDKILEGTYNVNSNNEIDYKLLEETQDYAFYTASTYRFEIINGEKTLIVDNSPNGKMYFQIVH